MAKSKALAVKENDKPEIIRPTKVDLFVDAFIRCRFNATQAALNVFDLGGDEKQRNRTAGSVGHEYLMKPETQKKLAERMARQDISVEYVLQRMKEREKTAESEDVAVRLLDRMAHFVGAEIKEKSTDVSAGRNPSLALYMSLPKESSEEDRKGRARLSKIIDVPANG
jgi:hypothetical protein